MSRANETIKEGDLACLIEDSDKREYYNLGRVTNTTDGSDGVTQSTTVRTNDVVYKRLVVKLAPLPGRNVFAMEKWAVDVVDECTSSTTKMNIASKPFQPVNLE